MFFLLAVLLSFVPALGYAYIAYSMDRYEKEPFRLLAGVFAWGAIVAVIGALMASILLEAGFSLFVSPESISLLSGSLVAPIVEEIYKGLAVLLVYLLVRHEFDSVLDGIIYAGVTALGFAATENVLYLYFQGYRDGGAASLFGLFVLRVLLGGWNHAVYTSFTGIGLAVSRLSHNRFVRIAAPAAGLLCAMIAHSLHNSLIALVVLAGGEDAGVVGLLATLLVDWVGWALVFAIMLWALRRERRWITTYLQEEVGGGLISPAQFATAASARARWEARMRGLSDGRFALTRRFYQLCSELAQKKHQWQQFGEEGGNSVAIAQLRGEIAQLAPQALA